MSSHLVGGISSGGRAVPPLDGRGLLIGRADGPWLWDEDGRRYIDTVLGFGASILGHAPPAVVEATTAAIRGGSMPAFPHAGEEAAAAALAAVTGDLSSVVFTNSGSEAVHLASRIARLATGRELIAKAAAGYDGWYDDVTLGQAGSREALMRENARPRRDRTVLLRYNDFEDVEQLFAETEEVAAVMLEPLLANAGCIEPVPGYLAHVGAVARRHGALVIADEVLMGFRLGCGLTSQRLGLEPDLATAGKAIGSGIAVAAVVGRPEIMRLAERPGVRAGTYSGNPVATAAVTSTLEALSAADYPKLLERGDRVREALTAGFGRVGRTVSTSGYGTVFTLWFSPLKPATYEEAAASADAELSLRWHMALRRRGVLTIPFPFGRLYLSFAHSEAVVAEVIAVMGQTAEEFRMR